MRVTRVRLMLLLFIGVVLVLSVGVSPVDAAVDEYIAEAFSDTSAKWTNDANAYDGDWGTSTTYSSGAFVTADETPTAYSSGFDSGASGSGTITQVDIIVRHAITGLDASDRWAITLDVGASTDNDLQAWTTANYALNNQTFTDVTEPNGGGWTWAEVRSAQVHFDCDKVGGGDKGDWAIYELSFKVTTAAGGTDYEVYPNDSMSFDDTASFVESFVKNLYDSTTFDDTVSQVVAFLQNIFGSVAFVGTTSLLGSFVQNLFESFVFAGTLSPSIILQTFLYDSFVVSGSASIAMGYTVLLFGGIVVTETLNLAGVFELSIYESFNVVGDLLAQKITQLLKNIYDSFPIVETFSVLVSSVAGSMFFQLFFGLNVWGYFGPLGLVIAGYIVAKKAKNLGIIWFIVECLILANYLALVETTPDYWWHIFILVFGLFSCVYPLWEG